MPLCKLTPRKRKQAIFGGTLAVLAGSFLLLQSHKTQTADQSKERPAYGHDARDAGVSADPAVER